MSSSRSSTLALPALDPLADVLDESLRNTFEYAFVYHELCVLASMQLFKIPTVFQHRVACLDILRLQIVTQDLRSLPVRVFLHDDISLTHYSETLRPRRRNLTIGGRPSCCRILSR